jgi:hypothetical protein
MGDMPCIPIRGGILCTRGSDHTRFKAGEPPPQGYIAWHEWAAAQYRGGLRQSPCGGCGQLLFPQERDGHECGVQP